MKEELSSLLSQQKYHEAFEINKNIVAKSNNAYDWFNHGLIAQTIENYQEVVDAMNKASKLLPDCPVIKRYRSDALFQLGRYKEAFADKEYRFKMATSESPAPPAPTPGWLEFSARIRAAYPQPDWDGISDLHNKTVLIFNESGHGDLIQNLRFLHHLKDRGAKVIVEAKPELVRLIKTAKNIDEVVSVDKKDKIMTFFMSSKKAKTPTADYVMSSQSLPYYFDADLTAIPMQFPYLFPEETNCEAVQIVNNTDKIKVGIAWAGNWKDFGDPYRSCHLKHFRKLTELSNIQVFAIQKRTDLGKMQRKWWQKQGSPIEVNLLDGSEGMHYIDMDCNLTDFHVTAEVIKNLDLLISVDTAVVHIAGAMNKPAWLLTSYFKHDWRWDVKWYNSVTVLKQKVLNDWDGLFEEVVAKLTKNI